MQSLGTDFLGSRPTAASVSVTGPHCFSNRYDKYASSYSKHLPAEYHDQNEETKPEDFLDYMKGIDDPDDPKTESLKTDLRSRFAAIAQTVGDRVDLTRAKVVVACPPDCSETGKQLILRATQESGATDVHLVPDAIAAATAVNFHLQRDWLDHVEIINGRKDQNWRHVLVCDCGRRAVTASILEIVDDRYELRSFCRNPECGGYSFDDCLLRHVLDEFNAEHGIYLGDFPETLPLILHECEQARIRLSTAGETTVFVRSIHNGLHLKVRITQETFESVAYEEVNKILATIRSVLHEQKMPAKAIDAVFMVGGLSLTPRLKPMLARMFQKEPVVPANPQQAKSVGAAILAEKLNSTPESDIRHTVYYDMCPLSLGVNAPGGSVYKYIFRGATLPISNEAYFDFRTNNTPRLVFSVYQGERVLEKDNRLITRFTVGDFPRANAGEILVHVTLTLDRKGQIDIKASATLLEVELDVGLQLQATLEADTYSVLERMHMYSVAEAARAGDEIQADLERRKEAIQSYYDNLCQFFNGPEADPLVRNYVDPEMGRFLEYLEQIQAC
jgi:molecular chaperone DnaK (HSP70)